MEIALGRIDRENILSFFCFFYIGKRCKRASKNDWHIVFLQRTNFLFGRRDGLQSLLQTYTFFTPSPKSKS